jgi:hypothetical protein
MLDEYSGANVFNLSLFAGLVIVTSIVVILIYGWLYGFNFMEQQVVGASRVMLAAHTAPQGAANAGIAPFPMQPAYTYGQGLLNPAPQSGLYGYGYTQRVTTGPSAGQYLCPVHGAVGLPNFDTNGIPHCPICGQYMGFNCMSVNSAPQMVGGNTGPNLFNPIQGRVGMGTTHNPAAAAAFNRGGG